MENPFKRWFNKPQESSASQGAKREKMTTSFLTDIRLDDQGREVEEIDVDAPETTPQMPRVENQDSVQASEREENVSRPEQGEMPVDSEKLADEAANAGI